MIVVAIGAAIIEYARTRTRAVVGFLAVVVIGQLILQNVTKVLVNRDRPDIHRLTGFSGSSFPSGHAVTTAATFAAVALLIGRGRSQRAKALLAGAAAGLAVAVAASRVFLGVHWLTDVIAGLAMGWAWFAISSIAFGGRVLRFGQPVEVAQHVDETLSSDRRRPRVDDGARVQNRRLRGRTTVSAVRCANDRRSQRPGCSRMLRSRSSSN